MKTIAIIPSGGKGLRMGIDTPKQYLEFEGKEIIAHTLDVFQSSDRIDEIAVSADPKYFPLLNKIKEKYSLTKLKYIVKGGETRQESVANALFNINANKNDLVAVHDAARPLLSLQLLNSAIDFAKSNGATVVALQARDTIIEGEKLVEKYHSRDRIYLAQTPQIFPYYILTTAMNKAIESNYIGTDESMIVKNAGYEVNIFPGNSINIKITTKADLKLYKFLVKFKDNL